MLIAPIAIQMIMMTKMSEFGMFPAFTESRRDTLVMPPAITEPRASTSDAPVPARLTGAGAAGGWRLGQPGVHPAVNLGPDPVDQAFSHRLVVLPAKFCVHGRSRADLFPRQLLHADKIHRDLVDRL
jgi:hypothetical protein